MLFLDRERELARLDALAARPSGGLAVVYGRRRIGKSRLLVEWTTAHGGIYTVADQSSSTIQRRYFATAIAERLAGFDDVEYPDWRVLLSRLAAEASASNWRGPIVIDELPYLAAAAPELASVLQRWIDRDASDAGLVIALAGSSQRMMQGLVLGGSAPLYGRAREVFEVDPLPVACIEEAFGVDDPVQITRIHAAWGGVPRYWELASEVGGPLWERIDNLVLDPTGPLHDEPDRLLVEEMPPAMEVRPVLDAIGGGAHRLSEIAGRLGRPATSLSRPMDRLVGLGLCNREVPFGESERRSKRSLYRLRDPFMRLWFRVVAPHRAQLAAGSAPARRALLSKHWPGLAATAWEDLCRASLPNLPRTLGVGRLGPWGPAGRWWHGNAPEWDVVSESVDRARLLVGEVKWHDAPVPHDEVVAAMRALESRPLPTLGNRYDGRTIVRALFVPAIEGRRPRPRGSTYAVTAADIIAASARAR